MCWNSGQCAWRYNTSCQFWMASTFLFGQILPPPSIRSTTKEESDQQLHIWASSREPQSHALVWIRLRPFCPARHLPRGDWRLHPDVVEQIRCIFRKANVDADLLPFWADDALPPVVLLREASGLLGQNAQAHSWPDSLLNAFPPIPLLLLTRDRVQQSK